MGLKLLKTRDHRIGPDAYAATRIYSVPNNELAGYRSVLWRGVASGYTGWSRYAPYPIDIATQKNEYGDRGQIVVQYRTLTNNEYMERFPPRGILLTNAANRSRRVNADRTGQMIQGIDPSDPTGQTLWKIVHGTGLNYETMVTFVVRACVNSWQRYIEGMAKYIGSVNTNKMFDFDPYGKPRHLRLTGMITRPSQFDNRLTWVDYVFLGKWTAWRPAGTSNSFTQFPSPTGWGGKSTDRWETISQKFVVATQEVPKYDADGKDTGEKSTVRLWRPADPAHWSYGPLFDLHNFSRVAQLLRSW